MGLQECGFVDVSQGALLLQHAFDCGPGDVVGPGAASW